MNIDIEKLNDLVKDSDKIFLKAGGEEVLIEILEIQKQVDEAVRKAELILEEKALELNPNFSSIQSDRIKVFYRNYGEKYRIDDNYLDTLSANFYKVTKRYTVDAKEVEKWTSENKGLPLGIKEVERKKSLSFSLKNHEPEE